MAIANPGFVGKRIFLSLLKAARTAASPAIFPSSSRHYRTAARHDVNPPFIYNSPAASLANMPSIVVSVKPSFNAKAISALELLIEKPGRPRWLRDRGISQVTSSDWLITNNRDASMDNNSGGSNGANSDAGNNNGDSDANDGIYANNGDGANNAFDNNGPFR